MVDEEGNTEKQSTNFLHPILGNISFLLHVDKIGNNIRSDFFKIRTLLNLAHWDVLNNIIIV
jgi:hypothetical protein